MITAPRVKQNIKRVPEGYLVTVNDSDQNSKLIINLAVQIARTIFTLAILSQLISILGRLQIIDLFVVRLFVVIITIALLGLLWGWSKSIYASIDQILVNLSFSAPELIFTNYPVSLGEETSILFRRRLRSGKTIRESGMVNAIVTCEECVTYDSGDSSESATENVFMQRLPEILVPAYESAIEVIFKVKIPVTSPASFEAKNNQIKWTLEVALDFPKLLKETSKFNFQIQPQIFPQTASII